jgi:dihydroorotate dehydrogenase (fumarate)
MDLSTTYMGLPLVHPFMAGACPLTATVDGAQRLEEAGASAIVLPSLFEEGAFGGELAVRSLTFTEEAPPLNEDLPTGTALSLNPRNYLAHLGRVRNAVRIPVIASLNGTSPGSWTQHAARLEGEGADGLELNLYTFSADPWDRADAVERRMIELVRSVRASIRIPLAVKLSPFYTSLPNFVRELDQAGAGAILLFNRFTPADIDLKSLDLIRTLHLSSSAELPLRLRWLAVLYGKVSASLGVTGGVHTADDALKAILCGATVVQVVSALLKHGADHLGILRLNTEDWLRQNQISSLDEVRGRMSLLRAPDPKALERWNYIYNLDSWYGSIPTPIGRLHQVRKA